MSCMVGSAKCAFKRNGNVIVLRVLGCIEHVVQSTVNVISFRRSGLKLMYKSSGSLIICCMVDSIGQILRLRLT